MDKEVYDLTLKAAKASYDEVKTYEKGSDKRTAQWEVTNGLLGTLTEQQKIDKDERVADQNAVVEREKFESESEVRKYESDAQDRRTHEENETKRFQVVRENVMNVIKTGALLALGIVGCGIHILDVNAEKELGYDVSDKTGLMDKVSNIGSKMLR